MVEPYIPAEFNDVQVLVEQRDGVHRIGRIRDVNGIGVALQVANRVYFIPWTAISYITHT